MLTLRRRMQDIAEGRIKTKSRIWMLLSATALYVGYEHGKSRAEQLDMQYMVEFSGQDEQIYKLLEKSPVFQLFYTSGDPFFEIFRPSFIKSSVKYRDVQFMFVNCSNHYQYCRNIDFPRIPVAVLSLPKDYSLDQVSKYKMEGEVPQVEYFKDWTEEGVDQFFQENGIIEKVDFLKKVRDIF